MDLWFVNFFWSDYSLKFCCFWQICINNGAKNTTKIFHSVVSCLKCWKSSIQEMSQLLNPEEIRVLQLFTNNFKETEMHQSYSPKQILEKIIQIYFCIRHKKSGKSQKGWISLIPLVILFLILGNSKMVSWRSINVKIHIFPPLCLRPNHIHIKTLDIRYYSYD